jgi:hypothetical protein
MFCQHSIFYFLGLLLLQINDSAEKIICAYFSKQIFWHFLFCITVDISLEKIVIVIK